MKKYAVIVAGGSGSRMGSLLPKQFLLIHNKPVLWYTLNAFLESNGLARIQEKSIVFVHDGVRCLIGPALIRRCYEEALQYGSAVPSIDAKDSVRILKDGNYQPVKRTSVKFMQTPQTFASDLLLPAYQVEYREEFTDDASVVEAFHQPIHLVEGEVNNIKITTPLDLCLAEKLLDPPQNTI